MSFPRYPKCKPSGVEWLGEVPEGWDVKRARAVGVFSSSGIDKKSVDGEQAVQMFNYLDVYKSPDKTLRYSEDLMWTTAPVSKVVEHSVLLDDILLTPSSETADDIGHAARVTYVPPNILYSYHLLRFRKGAGFDASFVTHCFNAVPIRSYFESVCTGTTRKVLVRDDFKNAPFAIPPLPEQTAIAEFLDRETGKIDELVAEQRRLMELLKEKRQAVISHAVTKGLNPRAPMKPSGIEWLGDMPVGWTCATLNRISSRVVVGIAEAATHAYATEGIPILRSTNVRAGKIIGEILFIDPTFAGDRESKRLSAGDLVTVRTGNAGVTAIVPAEFDGCQCFTLLITSLHDGESVEFYCYWMNSLAAQCYFSLEGWGTAQVNISVPILKSLPIPVPPQSEQLDIVAFLDSETSKFDTLTAEAQRAIDLLQERRTALISAAVTGQIDVRNQPRN